MDIRLQFALRTFFDTFFSRTALYLGILRLILRRSDIKINIQTYHVKLILFFILTMLLSVFFNNINNDYIQGVKFLRNKYLMDIFPMFLIVYFIKGKKEASIIFFCLIVSFCITNLYGIIEHFQGVSRVKGLTDQVMDLAGILILLFPANLILFLSADRSCKYRYFFLMALIVAIPVILFNQTRAVWTTLGFLIPIILYHFVKKAWKFWASILIFFSLFSFVIIGNVTYYARFNSIFDLNYQSNSERFLMWNSAFQMFADHPIFGVGLGNYSQQYQNQYISPQAKEPNLGHAHNNIFHVLAENGVIGGIAYFMMFGYFAYEGYFRWKHTKCVEAFIFLVATLGIFIQGLTEFNLYWKLTTIRAYWIILGVYLIFNISADGKVLIESRPK